MPIIFNRRNAVRHLWSALIVTTIVGCAALVYASLFYGKRVFYGTQGSRRHPAIQEKLSEEKCISICDSEECLLQSNILLNRVNPSADPCENFYEFACGKYLERISQTESDSYSRKLIEKLRQKLKALLDNIEPDPISATGKMKTVYNSCLNPSSSETKAVSTLLQFLARSGIPNWPNLEPDFAFEPSIQNVLANFIAYQEYGFADITTIYDFRFELGQETNATVGDDKGTYEEKENSARKYMVERVLQYFNLDDEIISEIWEESEAIKDAITHLKEESDEFGKTATDIEVDCEMDTEWTLLCGLLAAVVDTVDSNSGVSKRFASIRDDEVYFMRNLFSVLHNFNDRSIANYLSLNLLLKHLDDLNFYFRLIYHKDTSSSVEHMNIPTPIGHQQHCIDWIANNMPTALAYEYMNTVLKPYLEELEGLLKGIAKETADEISRQEWITDEVRKEMVSRIEGLYFNIVLLQDMLFNGTHISYFYEQFHPEPTDFMHNVFENQRFRKLDDMQGLSQVTQLMGIRSSLFTVNAGAGGGSIEVDFGVLFPPVYQPGLERLLNYVSMSTIVAHEIGHILQPFYYVFKRSDETARESMDEVTLCIKNQYSQYRYEFLEENVNGSKTIREDFPDLIAISIIDKFIEKYTDQENAVALPGFPYIHQQMLYISSTQIWCSAANQRDEEMNHKFDSHSLEKFRMLGMMQNSKGFAKAFNCPKGSFMNPSTKCSFFQG